MVWCWLKRLNCFKKSISESDLFGVENDSVSFKENSIDIDRNGNDESINHDDVTENAENPVANIVNIVSVPNCPETNELENINASSTALFIEFQQNSNKCIIIIPPQLEIETYDSPKVSDASNDASSSSSNSINNTTEDESVTDWTRFCGTTFSSSINVENIYATNNNDSLIAKNLPEIVSAAETSGTSGEDRQPGLSGNANASDVAKNDLLPLVSNNLILNLNAVQNCSPNDSEIFSRNTAISFITRMHECLSTTKDYYDLQSKIILIKNGTIFNKNISANRFEIISDCEMPWTNGIRTWQTKIQLKTDQNSKPLICTITVYDSKKLELIPRNFNLAKINNGEKFDALLYPNYKQLKYAEASIKAIEKSDGMLKKLWIVMEPSADINPKFHVLQNNDNEITVMFRLAVKQHRPTLICTQTNIDAEAIVLDLKTLKPQEFEKGLIIRLITRAPPNSKEELKHCIKTLSKNKNFYYLNKIIVCTLGIAPKLAAENGIKNNFFGNIFILNAQKSSEIDCWMVFWAVSKC